MGRAVAAALGGGGGAVVGLCVSFLVNQALYEISVNGFFAVLFGSALLFMGCLILYRVNALNWAVERPAKRSLSTYCVMLFACLVIGAGLSCFFLEKDWFRFIRPGAKVPMYTLLGVALWFALTFSIMDLFNFMGQYLVARFGRTRRVWQPIVSTPTQITVVLGAAVALGLFFGLVFGTLDVEDDKGDGLERDLGYTLPVGAAACALVGAVNQAWLRPAQAAGFPEQEYAPRGKAAYDDGI